MNPNAQPKAIFPDTAPGNESWLKLNAEYASTWPNITIKREPPADAKEFDGVLGKFDQYFLPKSWTGRQWQRAAAKVNYGKSISHAKI